MSSGVGLRTWSLRLASSAERTLFPNLTFSFTRRRCSSVATTTFSTSSTLDAKTTKNNKKKKEKVIVISGPTGAGKSKLALELSKRLNGEIISADSVQVYRGLDVGSAKPSLSDRKEVPHHLVDILHPSEDYSVGQFFEDARRATRDILDNGHVPIVAGGTGLYLRWYVYGKPDVPKASLEIASKAHLELMDFQENGDWDAAVQLVVKAGDPRVQYVAANDWYRLRRSLEIIMSSGSPPSTFQVPYDSFKERFDSRISEPSGVGTFSADGVEENLSKDLDYDFICFFLSTQRLDLYRMIDWRCEDMLTGSEGILSEARWLLDMGLLPNSNSATRAIGYRQAMEYLVKCREQGGRSSAGDFYSFLAEFQKASRNFAKRQLTWFRNELIYHWIDASQPLEKVLNFIYDAYHQQTQKLVVPDSLKMKKDLSSHREASLLKAYHTKNRHFINREECSDILDWISKTQG
ncbi:tRNA dimethylallyltransferase 9 isoform X2 [Telopea speciosissima]|uniref:tRNA dimethylallyltransferase 9 isoform X2 n=1 Tax=Telopea speciosissima TaxID=54955 RepID=UPI001CC68973|nr:tRNA dimethylallyltransferase 9 isoform X2 [Telopea speciosissima]